MTAARALAALVLVPMTLAVLVLGGVVAADVIFRLVS